MRSHDLLSILNLLLLPVLYTWGGPWVIEMSMSMWFSALFRETSVHLYTFISAEIFYCREGDTFGMPTWTVDPHDIYFISKGDGTNRVCRLGKGDFGPVGSPPAQNANPRLTLHLRLSCSSSLQPTKQSICLALLQQSQLLQSCQYHRGNAVPKSVANQQPSALPVVGGFAKATNLLLRE